MLVMGGAVASWLVNSTPDRVVWVQALAGDILLCSCARVIDQVRGQDGWILVKFFFCLFMDRDRVEVHKPAKKEQSEHPAILTEQAWSIKDLSYGFRGNCSCET